MKTIMEEIKYDTSIPSERLKNDKNNIEDYILPDIRNGVWFLKSIIPIHRNSEVY